MHCCGGSHNRKKEEYDDVHEIEKKINKKKKMSISHERSGCRCKGGH